MPRLRVEWFRDEGFRGTRLRVSGFLTQSLGLGTTATRSLFTFAAQLGRRVHHWEAGPEPWHTKLMLLFALHSPPYTSRDLIVGRLEPSRTQLLSPWKYRDIATRGTPKKFRKTRVPEFLSPEEVILSLTSES